MKWIIDVILVENILESAHEEENSMNFLTDHFKVMIMLIND